MNEEARSTLLAPAAMYFPLVAALVLTLMRTPRTNGAGERTKLLRVFVIGVAAQCAHFSEEYLTGLYSLYPPLFGLAPVPGAIFVGVNVFAIGVCLLATLGLWRGSRAACFPVWFFGVAMCLNGIIHPLLARSVGGCFPGLLTSPVAGIVGLLVMRKLIQSTESAVK